jgi:Na+/melibiose symporter-like transporter
MGIFFLFFFSVHKQSWVIYFPFLIAGRNLVTKTGLSGNQKTVLSHCIFWQLLRQKSVGRNIFVVCKEHILYEFWVCLGTFVFAGSDGHFGVWLYL